jgi:hypothetical protein
MTSFRSIARKKGIMAGLIEPSDEEKAQLEQAAQQQQQPDPQAEFIAAKTKEATASAIEKDRERRPQGRSGGSRRRSRCGSLAARWTEGGAHARADRQDDRRGRQDQDRHSASAREAEHRADQRCCQSDEGEALCGRGAGEDVWRRKMSNIVELKKPFAPDDIAATLRRIADDYEKGEYGLITTCLVAMGHTEHKDDPDGGPRLQRDRYELFGCGMRSQCAGCS